MNENSKDCIHLGKDVYQRHIPVYIAFGIKQPAPKGWCQRLLPSTSRVLDCGYYKPAQQKKQLTRYGYYTRKSSAIMV